MHLKNSPFREPSGELDDHNQPPKETGHTTSTWQHSNRRGRAKWGIGIEPNQVTGSDVIVITVQSNLSLVGVNFCEITASYV